MNNFGNIEYIVADDEHVEFIVIDVSFMNILNDFGSVVINDILTYYPDIQVLSLDKTRLKCCFTKPYKEIIIQ